MNKNITHELDGIKYDGDKKQTQEQLSSLPGCDRFHTGWLGIAKKEIVPFIKSLNIDDTVFCLFNTYHSKINHYANSKYKNVGLNNALIGGLQDRIVIVTQYGKSIFQIPYSNVDKVNPSNHLAKDGEINIIEKNGTNTTFFLDTINTDTELLGNRFCSWVKQNIHNSNDKKGKSEEERLPDSIFLKKKEVTPDIEANYVNLSIKDLKEILRKRGLSVGGKSDNEEEYKLELIERLEKDNYKFIEKVDTRDQKLIEQIREKYKAPEYEAPPELKTVYSAYPTYLSFLTFVLYCLGFLAIILYANRSEGANGEYYGKIWDNPVIFSVNNINIGYVQLYLFAIIGSLILGSYIFYKNSGRKLEKTPAILDTVGGFAFILLFIIIAIYFFSDVSLTIPCCSTIFLIVTVLLLEAALTLPDKTEEIKKEKEEETKERQWFDACKHENKNEYYTAKKIWLSLKEDRQVLRLEKLLLEYEYVRVHRRILDMEEKGVNCAKLREHLDLATMLADDNKQGAISFEARIE